MAVNKIGIVVMASGWSRRFGENKLLANFQGRALISYILDTVCDKEVRESGLFDRPMVVTRYQEIEEMAMKYPVDVVAVDACFQTQSDTIKVALHSEKSQDWSGVLFIAADQPLLLPSSIVEMGKKFMEHRDYIIRLATREGLGIAPNLFPISYRNSLSALTGDKGGGALVKNAQKIFLVRAKSNWEFIDIDTKEELIQLENDLKNFQNRSESKDVF